MKRNRAVLIKRLLAYGFAAGVAAQPALAATTVIDQSPLTATGGTVLPNVLFTLDNSGSMGSDFIPDYIAASGNCLTSASGSTTCARGDPPYSAGGEFGFNGVAYDPNFTYLPGITSNGQPRFNPPTGVITETNTPNDAYGKITGNTNVKTGIQDRKYCNPNSVCMRNGQTDTAPPAPLAASAMVSGTDDSGNTMSAGQFPYRTTKTNASFKIVGGVQTNVISLPEMMQIGSASRATTTVTMSTVEAHGLAVNDRVFVNSGTAGLAVTCATVATVANANTFTYATASGSGNITARTVSFRKCVTLGNNTFVRTAKSTTVTVTSVGHGMVTNDVITTANTGVTDMNQANVTIAVTDADHFTYVSGGNNANSTAGQWVRTGLYNDITSVNGPAIAYRIVPVEFCTDANLTDCKEIVPPPATPPADHPFPAYVRFCRTQEEAMAHGAVTFIATTPVTNRCQAKFVNITGTSYTFGRYGWFVRDTIVTGNAPFTGRPGRIDAGCSAGSCTYAAEIQNYAKWFAYYRTRMQMMKTAVGISFFSFISNPTGTPPKPDSLRVGFITIHAADGGSVDNTQYLKINNFNTTQANNLYTKFYDQSPSGGTPLREALSRAGWIFSGKLGTGLTAGIPAADDPIQSSCQKNYSLFTTDGFWNGNAGQNIAGKAMGNIDNQDPGVDKTNYPNDPFSNRATGTYDGNILSGTTAGSSPGGSGTLADVALYYYMTDLRGGTDAFGNATGPSTSPSTSPAGGDVSPNNVPSKSGNKDFATHQHMVTFTVGLADGLMSYDPDYENQLTGDFSNIKKATANACFWASGTCNWPAPQQDQQSALDDLWHAAVNGRGDYFLALNPRTLSNALTSTLGKVSTNNGAAAAAATSSPNITATDNFAFSTTYQTNTWSGIVRAQNLDATTGAVQPTILWEADTKLLQLVGPTPLDIKRNLWMFDASKGTKLKPFDFLQMTPAEQAFFTKRCNPPVGQIKLSQCGVQVVGTQITDVDAGVFLVDYLRGVTGNEAILFRDRTEVNLVNNTTLQTVLGDIVDSEPAFVRLALFNYGDPGYLDPVTGFKDRMKTRAGTLYVAANDGYLHAFDGTTGLENWAYMPKFVMPNVYRIADFNYASSHIFLLDGTVETNDVFDVSTSSWKTIIVGGANGGAQGFYALDITDPKNPKGLWEFCSDPNLCPTTGTIKHSDADLGFSYGNPVIGKLPATNPDKNLAGRWVVILTSGPNNVGSGVGFFYILDAISGEVLAKISTGVGDTITPSGLMRQGAFFEKGLVDATMIFLYGGDLQGNIWRVDLSQSFNFAAATDPFTVSSGFPFIINLAKLTDPKGFPQPVSARPVATNYTYAGKKYRLYYIGTGRYLGKPDVSDTQVQTIWGFKDVDDTAKLGYDVIRSGAGSTMVVQTLSTVNASQRTITNNKVDWTTQNGFMIDLDLPDSVGERIVLNPRLELGTLIFTSNVPIIGGCIPGGESFIYNLDFTSGSYVPGTTANIAGTRQGQFLVGVTPIQTVDGSIRTVNTNSAGGLGTGTVNINRNPKAVSRFSYRER